MCVCVCVYIYIYIYIYIYAEGYLLVNSMLTYTKQHEHNVCYAHTHKKTHDHNFRYRRRGGGYLLVKSMVMGTKSSTADISFEVGMPRGTTSSRLKWFGALASSVLATNATSCLHLGHSLHEAKR